MQEFNFPSLEELLEHYARYLSDDELQDILLDAAKSFAPRRGTSDREARPQFIRKCELAMAAVAELKGEGIL